MELLSLFWNTKSTINVYKDKCQLDVSFKKFWNFQLFANKIPQYFQQKLDLDYQRILLGYAREIQGVCNQVLCTLGTLSHLWLKVHEPFVLFPYRKICFEYYNIFSKNTPTQSDIMLEGKKFNLCSISWLYFKTCFQTVSLQCFNKSIFFTNIIEVYTTLWLSKSFLSSNHF